MPLYDVKCKTCDAGDTVFRKIAERDNLPSCACGGELYRLISAPLIAAEFTPYESPGTGKIIHSRTEMREDLARSGAILYEPGLKQDIARNREAAKAKAFAPIEAAVDQYVAAAVSAGKLET
jgi:putative FmdB family regulatory protein